MGWEGELRGEGGRERWRGEGGRESCEGRVGGGEGDGHQPACHQPAHHQAASFPPSGLMLTIIKLSPTLSRGDIHTQATACV